MKTKIEIGTSEGRGILGYGDSPILYITEIGNVMLKVWYPEKNSFVNYKISEISEILPQDFNIININQLKHAGSKSDFATMG
jgi:hypothetical protein